MSERDPAATAQGTTADTGGLTAEQSQARKDELQLSLTRLAQLVMGATTIETMMTQVASAAVSAIPGAEGAGVTLLNNVRSDDGGIGAGGIGGGADLRPIEAIAASHPFVREVDAIQYELLDEGPCITAATERQTVVSNSLDDESRWPRFTVRVRRLGVRSTLSLPMTLPDGSVIGALNVYSRTANAFDDGSVRLAALYATPAAVAVHNSHLLGRARAQAEQLRAALVNRAVIDQAIGILRSRSGVTANEGFAVLRERSQRENIKLAVIAERIVDEAVRRAQARRAADRRPEQ